MTAIDLPAPDAPAEEWGRLAVSIPGWRGPWSADPRNRAVRLPGFVRKKGHWHWVADIFDEMPCIISTRLEIVQRAETIPDPDHWAWEGWLWRLAGRPEVMVERGGKRVRIWDGSPEYMRTQAGATGITKGRALISYAAALGRWPGEVA